MIRDLDLVAVHCQHHWTPTFKHGDHSSRIDFMFVRRHQVQWTKHRAQVLTRFERTIGSSAPEHHPLAMSLPKWFAPPRITPPINSIDRHRLRLEYQSQTENWLTFESEVMNIVCTLTTTPKSCDPISTCIQVEQAIRHLCQNHFPRVSQTRPTCSQVKSLAAQMWLARRQLLRLRSVSLQALFRGWSYVIRFEKIHQVIRRQSRQNRRIRLDTFLAESVPFVLQNRLHDWYKRIRILCPKQTFRRIQMFDLHGAPLSQELERLTQYFQDLFTDSQAPLSIPPALTYLPFTEADVFHELQHLPVTKALAPDGFPALIWRHFAEFLTPVVCFHVSVMHGVEHKVYHRHIGPPAGSIFLPNPIKHPINRRHSDRYVFNTRCIRSCPISTAVCYLTRLTTHFVRCPCTRTCLTEERVTVF